MAEQARVGEGTYEPEPNYGERLQANIRWLIKVNEFSIESTAGLAAMSPRALHGILGKGTDPNPERKTVEKIARALGVLMPDLWLSPEELVEKVNTVGLRPFAPRRNLDKGSGSSPTSEGAADAGDLSDWDFDQMKVAPKKQRKQSSRRPRRTGWSVEPAAHLGERDRTRPDLTETCTAAVISLDDARRERRDEFRFVQVAR